MPGIKVEIKRGKNWWYVVADFGDGQLPVTKGPMSEDEAKAMAAELQQSTEGTGAMVLERSEEEERANRKAALAFFATVGSVVLLVVLVVLAWVTR